MINACYLCHSVACMMYRCGNSSCSKVFCRNCGRGWDQQTCPACGNHASQGAGLIQAFVDVLTPREKPGVGTQLNEPSPIATDDGLRRPKKRTRRRRPNNLESSIERLAEQMERKGLPCPHCGGGLPTDSRVKQYRVCRNCRRDLFWAGGQPFSSQADADACSHELELERAAEEKLIEMERAEMDAEEREETDGPRGRRERPRQAVSLGIVLHLAAVIASVDGKLSSGELDAITNKLAQSDFSEAQVKERFITICRRVHREGLDNWVERLCAMIRDQDRQEQARGMTADELLSLLHQLITVGGGETKEKQQLIGRFASALHA